MRIVSHFSDYYDIGLSYGIDDKLRFEREPRIVKNSLKTQSPLFIVYTKQSRKYRISLFFNLIGFCGKIYPFVKTVIEEVSRKNKKDLYKTVDQDMAYDLVSLNRFITNHYMPLKEITNFDSFGYSYGWKSNLYQIVHSFYFEKYEKATKVFEADKTAHFTLEQRLFVNQYERLDYSYILILTPVLKAYKFAKVVPPMQAFQEIAMYLGGVLNSVEDNTVTIEDGYLAQAKGFDCYSFKKAPTKKKQKKCK